MKTIFKSDFSNNELVNWSVEQHVPYGYMDFDVQNGKLVCYDAGNRLLPNIPPIKNFILKGCFDADWDINNKEFRMRIHFEYNKKERQGKILDISSNGEELSLTLQDSKEILSTRKLISLDTPEIAFELCKVEQKIMLLVNEEECLSHHVMNPEEGMIALERGAFLGELRISEFELQADVESNKKVFWENLEIPFAPINGMDIPVVWTVNAYELGENFFQVDVELSGGEKTRADIPWFPYHAHYVEFLKAPYLRIESEHYCHDLELSEETFVLAQPTRQWFYTFHEEPIWPFRRSFFIRGLEAEARLFAGYQAYGNRSVNKHQEVTEPYETVLNVKTGKIVYAGPAIPAEQVVLELNSPEDKRICGEIPETVHDYEKALAFARKNHYFFDSEDCRFCFGLIVRFDLSTNELSLLYRVENAFFEALGDFQNAEFSLNSQMIVPGIERLYSKEVNLGKLKPGVYHLRFQLYKNNVLAQEGYRAFEVNGKNESALYASRMPICFSMHNEVKACDTDYFDPWKKDCVDVSHYIQICNAIMPHFAREKRLWELLKIYKRQWFLWHDNRTIEECDIEKNKDLIKHCDFIFTRPDGLYFRPAARKYFHKDLVKILYEYAVKNNVRVKSIREALDNNTFPDKETFDVLVGQHYQKFLDFLIVKHMNMLKEMKRKLEEINPNIKFSSYGPVTLYAAAYKTAHALSYKGALAHGDELRGIRDGFFIFEDYPYACRYSINRGPFLVADLKMRTRDLTIYPEFYNNYGGGVPCPDAAVARVFPSYGIRPIETQSLGSTIKRVLEYVYACVWHDGRTFDYWRDYGFQTRAWEQERYEALLRIWGFVDKHPPVRPLKANVFISSEACCRQHKIDYDEYPGDKHEAFGDLINTAEECIAYAYEMSRNAGQNAGFVAEFKSLRTLDASDIDTLILPPLISVEQEDLNHIVRLHKQGVSLLAFENVDGLEELFGVESMTEAKQVNTISINDALVDNPLADLGDLTEYTEHRSCEGKYQAKGANVLLNGEVPVLFSHRTEWGKTALFNIPPTTIRRQDQFNRVSVGRDSVSSLINRSTQLVLKHLTSPAVETNQGKIIAFEDRNDKTHIIVMEDSHPFPAKKICPLITLNLPGLRRESISCDKPFSIVGDERNKIKLRVTLDNDEFAIFSMETGVPDGSQHSDTFFKDED